MKLTMLGTGHAMVLDCYNTCFVMEEDDNCIMVDCGGGNRVLAQLKKAGIPANKIHHIIITHPHADHVIGAAWMVRSIVQFMQMGRFEGDAYIYGHDGVIRLVRAMAEGTLLPSQLTLLDKRLHLVEVKDGETRIIGGREVTFFDILSTKTKQFGFSMKLKDGGRFTCCGDEPCSESGRAYARGSRWMTHEAFCLYAQADIYQPYEKHHSTVKDACELAEELGVENLILYHTEEENLARRKELYTAEGKQYFKGNLFVPEDLESIEIF